MPTGAETVAHATDPAEPSPSAVPARAMPEAEPATDPDPAAPSDAPASPAIETKAAEWANLSSLPMDFDQLGLANPEVITVRARLPGWDSLLLEADRSGLYQPRDVRTAPWSGFGYDQAQDLRTGLAAGTRILTARGEVEVENLLPGDAAMTLRTPALVPISWIGRSVANTPAIRIERDALGPNVPRRTLCLGADQAVYIKPVPVAARALVNGTTIRQAQGEVSDLFHVDVGRAEILFAEGIPLSSGDRASLRIG